MFEVVTVNGFRRLVRSEYIVAISELRNNGRSNTVITLSNNETLFVENTYDQVKAMCSDVQSVQ